MEKKARSGTEINEINEIQGRMQFWQGQAIKVPPRPEKIHLPYDCHIKCFNKLIKIRIVLAKCLQAGEYIHTDLCKTHQNGPAEANGLFSSKSDI